MKYKNEEIKKPTQELIQEYINECGLKISAEEVVEYWADKNFLTRKGQPVKTLEALVNVVNSLKAQKLRKLSDGTFPGRKSSKHLRWLNNHFKFFCECMNTIKKENPQRWQAYIKEANRLGVFNEPL